jgi:protein-tyrosine phosphatase
MTLPAEKFPFTLSDVIGWIIKRKDGTTVKYVLTTPDTLAKDSVVRYPTPTVGAWTNKGYSAWCNHEPHPEKDLPIFQAEGIALWVGDNPGARKSSKEFDMCIDGGNVLDLPGQYDLPVLYGDPDLQKRLNKHLTDPPKALEAVPGATRILKIRWADRCKPPVKPEFWPGLLAEIRAARDKGGFNESNPYRVMTICQGGHGRSGSAAAALIMCLSDYTPLDALTHVRAMHCARAIESKEQHEYLNTIADMLGRKPNALEAEGVASFKERLLGMKSKWAAEAKRRIEADRTAGALREEREGSYL